MILALTPSSGLVAGVLKSTSKALVPVFELDVMNALAEVSGTSTVHERVPHSKFPFRRRPLVGVEHGADVGEAVGFKVVPLQVASHWHAETYRAGEVPQASVA